MISFIKSILTGKSQTPEEKEQEEKKKEFDILKYDGIRAIRLNQPAYAEKCLTAALALQQDTEVMEYLTHIYLATEREDQAIETLHRLCEIHPDRNDYLLYIANIHYRSEAYEATEELCRKVMERDHTNTDCLYQYAQASHKRGNDLQAIALLTQALTQSPTLVKALQLRASILYGMQQYAEAGQDINQLKQLDGADSEEVTLLESKLHLATGQTESGISLLKSLIEENPFHQDAYLLLGNTLLADGKTDEAIALYDEALETNPAFAAAYYKRGRAKLQKGDSAGSLDDMKKAMEADPKIAEAISGEFNNQK